MNSLQTTRPSVAVKPPKIGTVATTKWSFTSLNDSAFDEDKIMKSQGEIVKALRKSRQKKTPPLTLNDVANILKKHKISFTDSTMPGESGNNSNWILLDPVEYQIEDVRWIEAGHQLTKLKVTGSIFLRCQYQPNHTE